MPYIAYVPYQLTDKVNSLLDRSASVTRKMIHEKLKGKGKVSSIFVSMKLVV